ncbi:MAG: hypothetical protein WBQ94_16410 [Terracidiphilus sp.]
MKSDVINRSGTQWDHITFSGFEGEAKPSKSMLTLLGREVQWDDAGKNEDNPSGVHLRFEKIDERTAPEGVVVARYRVFAEGAPENTIYGLRTWVVGKEESSDPTDLYVNGQGLLMIHKPKPEQETRFSAGDDEFHIMPIAGNAEPIRYLLFSMDGRLEIYGTLVPHPVMAEDQGCSIEARIAQPDAAAVLIIVNRFAPKSKVPVVLKSEGKLASEVLSTDANGHAVLADFPYVTGKTQGMLKASAEGEKCLPSVTLPWGPSGPVAAKVP